MVFRAYNLIAGMISLTLGLDSVISTEHNSYSSESVKVIFHNVDSFVLIIWKKNLPDNKFKKSIIITKFIWSAIILNIWVEFLFVENNQARLISRKVVSKLYQTMNFSTCLKIRLLDLNINILKKMCQMTIQGIFFFREMLRIAIWHIFCSVKKNSEIRGHSITTWMRGGGALCPETCDYVRFAY